MSQQEKTIMSDLKYRETNYESKATNGHDAKQLEMTSYADPPAEEEKVGLKRQVPFVDKLINNTMWCLIT